MRVRMLDSVSSVPFARRGAERDLNDVLALRLIAAGQAVAVEAIEEAVAEAPENASTRPGRRRGAMGKAKDLLGL